jgi:hypothetical protein
MSVSTRQIAEVFERIEWLVDLGVDRVLADLDAALVRRLARRVGLAPPLPRDERFRAIPRTLPDRTARRRKGE